MGEHQQDQEHQAREEQHRQEEHILKGDEMVKYQSIIERDRPIVRQEEGPSMYRQVRGELDRKFKRISRRR